MEKKRFFFPFFSPLMQAIFQRKAEKFQFSTHMTKSIKVISQQPSAIERCLFSSQSYDTFNESFPLFVKQSRWFNKPMGSKGSQVLGVRQLCHQAPFLSVIKEMPPAGRETAAYEEGRQGIAM